MAHLKQFMQRKPCWAIMPVSVAKGLEQDCNIKRVDAAFELPEREVSILTALDSENNIAITNFYACLKEIVSKYPEIDIMI